MAIKGADLLTVGNQILIHRIQTGGPGQVTIGKTKVYELGNYLSVGQTLDIPDLSFPCESIDATADMEAMLTGNTFLTDVAGTEYDLNTCVPVDVVQQFTGGKTAAAPFDVVGSVALPYLAVESISYKFGLKENAGQTATLKGDSIVYAPGSMYIQTATGTNSAGQTVVLAHDALPNGDDVINGTRYALGVCLAVSGTRLLYGIDYTETVGGSGTGARPVTIVVTAAVPTTDTIRVVYASNTAATYPQSAHDVDPATVAPTARPAALRGRNIQVYVGGLDTTNRWVGVQSVSADWKITLDRDEEFGNNTVVAQDYDVASVTGSIEVKPRNPAELLAKIQQITGVTNDAESIGALRQVALPLDIVLHDPEDGTVLKTLHVPDARFSVPGFSGRVQQKLALTFNFESDGGTLKVYKGVRPPVIESISPAIGARGTAVPVTITGDGFGPGATVAVSGTGVTASAVTVVSSTSITATLTMAIGATLGARNVTVTNANGGAVTSTGVFTVLITVPTLTSVTPSAGGQGAAVPVALVGTDFATGADVTVSGTGITVSSIVVNSATSISATFTLAGGATLSARNVTVTNTDTGTVTSTGAFTVHAAPTLTSVTPNTGAQGNAVGVTLAGTGFVTGAAVTLSGTGVTVSGVTVDSAIQISATFTIAGGATISNRDVTVTNTDLGAATATAAFDVTA